MDGEMDEWRDRWMSELMGRQMAWWLDSQLMIRWLGGQAVGWASRQMKDQETDKQTNKQKENFLMQ